MELLIPSLRRSMNFNNSDDCHMSLDETKNVNFASDEPEGEEIIFKIEMHLIGDLKGLFQILCRSGFYSLHCVHCMYRSNECKSSCSLSSSCLSCEKWTSQKISAISVPQYQCIRIGASFGSVGVSLLLCSCACQLIEFCHYFFTYFWV